MHSASSTPVECETVDDVFSIHLDFAHRTGGRKASLRSAVGNYHMDVAMCKRTMQQNEWEESVMRQLSHNRVGHRDSCRSLHVEAARRVVVRKLIDDITAEINKAAMTAAAHEGEAAKGVPRYQVVELLTGWILHERNDPPHEEAVATLTRFEATDGGGFGAFSWEASRDLLFPATLRREFVRPMDVGRTVRMRGAHRSEGSGHGAPPDAAGEKVYVLQSLVNPWRGVLSPLDESAEEGGALEAELADLALVTPAAHVLDILIPSPELNPRGSSTAVFVRLSKWCRGKAAAAAVAARVTELTQAARQALFEAAHAQPPPPPASRITIEQSIGSVGGEQVEVVVIRRGALRCPMLLRAWLKMRALYRATWDEPVEPSGHLQKRQPRDTDDSKSDEVDDTLFARRLLVVLLRYASLSGAAVQSADQTAGFHASVPPAVYALLRERLSCVVEGFASPMNSTSTAFCSLFPDCDSYFGSLGSFFSLSMKQHFPRGISMTCNPPYSVVVMLRVPEHLSRMFHEADELGVPLQVFIVVCNWSCQGNSDSGDKILDRLRSHKFCVRHVSIEPSKAPFQDGHAFVLNRPFFTLGSNTELFLYQNDAAHRRWPQNRGENFSFVVDSWMNISVEDDTAKKRARDTP